MIITRLGKTRKIRVTPTEAIRRYSEQGTDPLIAARSLQVESVLTGTVQHSGERVRVTVQLFRTSDGQPLWTDEFDQRESEIFMLQDSISQRLVEALTISLSGDEKHQLVRNSTGNVEAYQLYLKGRYYWAKRLPDPVRKGIQCFEDAVALDPNYAPAYAGLADSYALTASGLAPAVRMPKAKAAAERALAIALTWPKRTPRSRSYSINSTGTGEKPKTTFAAPSSSIRAMPLPTIGSASFWCC